MPRLCTAAVLLALLALAGCGGEEGDITVYSGRQEDLVVSLYLTRLRHHIERKTYLPFDEWFRVATREPHLTVLDDLRFHTIVSHYARLFGRAQVSVLLFEELKAAPETFAHKLARILGVEAESLATLLRDQKENVCASEWPCTALELWKLCRRMLL